MASSFLMDTTMVTSTCCVELDRFSMAHGELENSIEAREASVKVRSLYDAGTPLFSKKAIEDVVCQLNSSCQIITIHGLDTEPVTFQKESGQTLVDDDGFDWIIGDPFVQFNSVQALCSHTHGYAPGLSLCSMWICHYLTKRRRMTNELISLTPSRSQDGVLEFFRTQKEAWVTSEYCRELRSVLLAKMTRPVTKIVAFACGRMAFYDTIPSARSAYQHALILTLRDVLSEVQTPSNRIKCYAQDPIYGEVDRRILEFYGICILDNPQGFLEVNDSTAVLSFGPNVPIRQVVAEISRPAMMIWDKCRYLENEFEDKHSTDPDSPRLTKMIQGQYIEIEFPGTLEAFEHSKIYIRNRIST